jgi:tRNA A-37 threonylcarbamoyl transferase component Bud32
MSSEPAEDPQDPVIGEILANRYQVEVKLGEGAMGAVYKARHIKVGRPFAVKVLHKQLLEDRKTLQRFEREAELAGRLHHPNVIGVIDVGETSTGDRYMVMDFAEGADLATLLAEAPMPPERIVNLTRQMLEGLYHAHEQGLIHRDFKPENVIVERNDHGIEVPRIVDFGIAILREGGDSPNSAGRLTTNGLVLGTPHYMAPEQAVADPIDHRIDLFALGIVIYELLCGKLPFDGSGAEVARANLLLDPPPIAERVPFLEVDPLLEAFARRLLAKKRDQRPATAKAARELLDRIVADRAAAAAELGVPLEASRRQPAETAPQQPVRAAAAEDAELAAPVIVESPPAPAAAREAPPVQAPVIAAFPPTATPLGREHAIRTELADPIDLTPPRSRGRWLMVIGGGVAAAAIATLLVMKSGGGGSGDPPPQPQPEPERVVMQAPDPDPDPDPTPAPEPPVSDPDPSGDPAEGTTEPAPDENELEIDMGSDVTPRPSKQPIKRPIKRPIVARNDPGRQVATPDPPRPAIPDAATVSALYRAVGADLAAAAAARGEPAVAAIKDQLRLIRLDDALRTDQTRVDAVAKLQKLRAQLAPLKQK